MRRMKNLLGFATALAIAAALCGGCATTDAARIPLTVMPYYSSEPLEINVGKFSDKLLVDNPQEMLETAKIIATQLNNVPIETLYVLATRLYDLDQKIPAAYWFYDAQARTKILQKIVNDGTFDENGAQQPIADKMKALNTFQDVLGGYINEVVEGQPETWGQIIATVTKDVQNLDCKALLYDIPQMANKIVEDNPEIMAKTSEAINAITNYLMESSQGLADAMKNH